MNRDFHFLKISFLALALFLTACAGMPVQEMSNARQAVDAARKAGAESSAPKELESAETLLQEAEKALEDGDYGKARASARAARDKAVSAQDKAQGE